MANLYNSFAQPLFEAETRVLIRQEGVAVNPDRQTREDRNFLATQAEVIRSPLMMSSALERAPFTRPADARKSKDNVTLALEALRVGPVAKTDVLTIGFRSENSEEIGPLIRELIVSYKNHVQQSETTIHAEVLDLITGREAALREEIATLEQQLLELRAQGPLMGQGRDTVNVHVSLLRDLSEKITETQRQRLQLEYRLKDMAANGDLDSLDNVRLFSLLRSLDGTELTTSAGDPLKLVSYEKPANPSSAAEASETLMPKLTTLVRGEENTRTKDLDDIQQELWKAKAKAREIANQYGPRHSQAIAVNEQVQLWEDLLRKRLLERMTAVSEGLAQDHASASSTEQRLQAMYDSERKQAKELDGYVLREKLIVDNIRRLESLHEVVLKTLTDIEIEKEILTKGRASIKIEQLEEPERTLKQVWPMPVPILGLSGIIGVTGGLMFSSFVQSVRSLRRED
ncbi:MAG: hypothetical protein MI865_06110 [Proteobacteria bacterium]|nr:hypothetical protein [Pseudomonadota bacterium]